MLDQSAINAIWVMLFIIAAMVVFIIAMLIKISRNESNSPMRDFYNGIDKKDS